MDPSYRAAGILKSNSSLLRIFLYWGPRQATPGHSRQGRILTAWGPRRVAVSPDWDSGLLSLLSLSTVQSCQPRGGEIGSARNQWSLMFIIPANNVMIQQYHNHGTFFAIYYHTMPLMLSSCWKHAAMRRIGMTTTTATATNDNEKRQKWIKLTEINSVLIDQLRFFYYSTFSATAAAAPFSWTTDLTEL